ncbi:hypothetical protein ACFQ4C_13705 [Larkinella insperata]|uniref:Uncharacterized protein n=1 Tax=Larkinella insperata TaxID=332158 RepID=A0ABW3QBE8_9BACT|nr:hypothetical protein [Larkinella insperata]
MKNWLFSLAFLLAFSFTCFAQDQYIGQPIGEVKAQLDKKRIVYTEQSSPTGDAIILSYSVSEIQPGRVDLFFNHSLIFQQAAKDHCVQLISTPMLQKPWVPDTLKNRLTTAGYRKIDETRFVNDQIGSQAVLEYIRDTQQPNVRMLRVVYRPQPKQAEK